MTTDTRRSAPAPATVAPRRPWTPLRVLWWVLLVLPWAWFPLRDALGPVTDVIALAMPVLALTAVGFAGLCALRRPAALAPAASFVVMTVVAVVLPWLPADAGVVQGPGLRVLAGNVGGDFDQALALRDLSEQVAADVVVMPEPSRTGVAEIGALFPHRFTAVDDDPKIAVFSRYPLRLVEGPDPDMPGARVAVDTPGGEVVVYALHVPRPWFRGPTPYDYQATVPEHFRQIEEIVARLRSETSPVVLLGDLNSTDRGRDYRTLVAGGELVDAMRDSFAAPTSVGQWLPLLARIDHVMVGRGWCGDDAERLTLSGSEHHAVTAVVGPCAP